MAELRTERLLIRPWRESDIAPWTAMNADPEVREHFMGLQTAERSAEQVALFQGEIAERGWGWWALEVAASGEFVGMAGLDPVEEEMPVGGVEIGWRLARPAWGHGYATEAARGVADFGFTELGLPEILALTTATNVRSQAVMRRLGMTHDPAEDFEDLTVPAGPLRPTVVYRLARP